MFRLESTEALYILISIPIFILFFIWMERILLRRITSFGSPQLIQRLTTGKSDKHTLWRYIIYIAIIFWSVLAATNPQWGTKREKVKVEKADIFIALDISNSMNATDISPSRLERAKKFAESLIQSHKGDRIALIFFAGGAYLQMPLTADYAAALMFLRAANTSMAGTQGTDIEGALRIAQRASEGSKHQKALILLTDGEEHDGDAIAAAKQIHAEGFSIFTIGVGTENGSLIPFSDQGIIRYKTDDEGNPVRSRINTEVLKALAEAGNGGYYLINEGESAVKAINSRLEGIRKNEMEIMSFTEYNSYFQYLLAPAIILLLLSFFNLKLYNT